MEVLEVGGEPPPPVVADVDRGRRRRRAGEEAPLRGEVLLHGPVQVEVILAQVREDERIEPDPVEPPERCPVRRSLDRRSAVARTEHLSEEPLEIDRLGGGEGCRSAFPAHDPLDGSDEPAAPTGRLQDGVQQKGRRRLAVGAGHTDDLELPGRLPEERVGRDRHRSAHVGYDELRHRDVELAPDDEGSRAPLDRLPGEIVPVDTRTGNAEKESAVRDAPRVVRKVADRNRPGSGHLARGERPDQGLELHLVRRLAIPCARPESAGAETSRVPDVSSCPNPTSGARPAEPRDAAG